MKHRLSRCVHGSVLLFCLNSVSLSLFAQPSAEFPTLTLSEAIEKTLTNNPQLSQFNLTQQQLVSQRESASLSPGYELSFELENFAGTGDVTGIDSAEITVALSSVIELGDKRDSRLSVANEWLNRVELDNHIQTLDVLGALTQRFIELLTTQAEIKLNKEATALSKALFSTVEKRARQGAASDSEVMRARATLTRGRIQQSNLQRKLERQKVSLARFWGETDVTFSKIDGDLFVFGESQSFSELYEKVRQSPSVTIFASEVRLKEAEIRLAKAQGKADLSWQFGLRHFEESGDAGLTLGVSMPLFSESRNRGAINASLSQRNALELQRSERLLALHDRLFSAYSLREQFIHAHTQLKVSVIPDLEKALRITREGYDRGRLKYQDWIAAQQELINAKQQLIETASAALLNQALIEQLSAEPLTN
ncbi:MAG: TolC family protein [Pseudomonadales bacterium]|nr:TolC family protein [Pseudomonadales bacterium]